MKRGFKELPSLERSKRGVPIEGPHANSRKLTNEPNDPLFRDEWYIVCSALGCSHFLMFYKFLDLQSFPLKQKMNGP